MLFWGCSLDLIFTAGAPVKYQSDRIISTPVFAALGRRTMFYHVMNRNAEDVDMQFCCHKSVQFMPMFYADDVSPLCHIIYHEGTWVHYSQWHHTKRHYILITSSVAIYHFHPTLWCDIQGFRAMGSMSNTDCGGFTIFHNFSNPH